MYPLDVLQTVGNYISEGHKLFQNTNKPQNSCHIFRFVELGPQQHEEIKTNILENQVATTKKH